MDAARRNNCDRWHRRVDNKTVNHVGAPRAVCTANHASRVSDPDVVRDPRHGSFSLKREMIVSRQIKRCSKHFWLTVRDRQAYRENVRNFEQIKLGQDGQLP